MDSQQHSLLVVEDDDATRAFLADNLAADGFRVATAGGAGEGLRAIEVRRPDLVLLDLMLEGARGGLELLDRVRAADGLGSRIDPAVPVIVVSGRASETDRVRGFARGADDYVTKPMTSIFGVARSGSRWRMGRHASSTPATTSGRAHGTTIQRSTATAAPP